MFKDEPTLDQGTTAQEPETPEGIGALTLHEWRELRRREAILRDEAEQDATGGTDA